MEERTLEHRPTRESIAVAIITNLLCRPHIILMEEEPTTKEVTTYISLRRLAYLRGQL